LAVPEEPLVYIDGKFYPKSEAKISVYDHGFLYGDGVFEGIRAYNGVVFKLKEHIDRLYKSAKTLMLEIPLSREEMIKAVLETLRRNKLVDAYIRLVVTRGVGDLGLDPRKCKKPTVIIIAEKMITLYKGDPLSKGVKAAICWVRRDPVDGTSHEVKSLNYLNSVLAKIEANLLGVDEAIFLNSQGYIVEGTADNIFLVMDGKLVTPPTTTGAMAGITRQVVLEIAEKLGIPVEERNITPHEAFNADEVFFTGTAAEIIPVVEINGRVIGDGKPGEITRRIAEEFRKLRGDPRHGVPIYAEQATQG